MGHWVVRATNGTVRIVPWDKAKNRRMAIIVANLGNEILEVRFTGV